MRLPRWLVVSAPVSLLAGTALHAQSLPPATTPEPEQSISVIVQRLKFARAGTDVAPVPLAYDDLVMGLRLTWAEWLGKNRITVLWGSQNPANHPTGAAVSVRALEAGAVGTMPWTDIDRFRLYGIGELVLGAMEFAVSTSPGTTDVGFLHGGIALGLGGDARLSMRTHLETRGTIGAGVTFDNDSSTTRHSRLYGNFTARAEATGRIDDLFGPLGLVLSVNLEHAEWQVPARRLYPGTTGRMHPFDSDAFSVRAGLSWR